MTKKFAAVLALALSVLAMSPAMALSLINPGDHGTINGALFYRSDPNPTGTGTIDSFLRVQHNDSEQGYNTDGGNPMDDKGGNFTHSIRLNGVGRVSFDNGQTYYREFMLDANEVQAHPTLTMTSLKIYLESTGNMLGYPTGFGTPIYDLGVGNSIDLTAAPGSGRGDMFAYIPDALFTGPIANPYVYLYCSFTGTDDGIEEWAVQGNTDDPPPSVPEPMTLSLLGLGLGLGALMRRRVTR
ncbi:PEP-CTERM sorting domain-containing protein [bacterium]|nr:PEP-CTERM sorting domain-containing protein [bacterium]